MQLLNPVLRIYSVNMSELTFGEVRGFHNFSDDEPINNVAAFYDQENDRFVINESRTILYRILHYEQEGIRKEMVFIKNAERCGVCKNSKGFGTCSIRRQKRCKSESRRRPVTPARIGTSARNIAGGIRAGSIRGLRGPEKECKSDVKL